MSLPWVWPPATNSSNAAVNTDDVENVSDVPGANASDALDDLQAQILALQAELGAREISMRVPWIPAFGSDPDWNEEFADGTSPVLEDLGFICERWDTAAPTPMTRKGDVCWFANDPPAVNEYNSTIIGGQLLIQSGSPMILYKTFDVGTYCFAARMRAVRQVNGVGIDCRLWVYTSDRVSATPERNAFGTGLLGGGDIYQFIYTNNAGAQLWNVAPPVTAELADIYATDLRVLGGVNGGAPAQTAWSSSQQRIVQQRLTASFLQPMGAVAAGILIQTENGALNTVPASLGFIAIDWIRRDANTALP